MEIGPVARPIRVQTADHLTLHGLIYGSPAVDCVIHVHGKHGNHYENRFLWSLAAAYERHGLRLVVFSNRGAHVVAEAYREGTLEFTGGAVERFEECVLDIEAVRSGLLQSGMRAVAIQGHSFGCEKVIFHARSCPGDYVNILLSPADTYANALEFFDDHLPDPEPPSRCEKHSVVSWSTDRDAAPYGVCASDGSWYPVPISERSLHEMFRGEAVRQCSVLAEPLVGRFIVYLGDRDRLQIHGTCHQARLLSSVLSNIEFVSDPNGDHHLGPDIEANADAIARALVSKL